MQSDKSDEDIIYAKGTELDILAKNLVECVYDENEETREVMQQSLVSLGIKEPKLILSLILSILKTSKAKKISLGHRVTLLSSMNHILKQKDYDIRDFNDLISKIIKQVIDELTSSKEIIPEWQSVANDILVTMSTHYCHLIMTPLIDKLQPSVLPHYFVIHVLGTMAVNNPYDMVSYLSCIITQILTLLSLAKTDNFRWVIATSFSQFCEAILEYVANPDRAPDPNVTMASFSQYIFSAFEVFFTNWLSTKESKLRKAILDAIGNMVFIIEKNNFEPILPKLINGIILQYKKHTESYHVTKALSQVLQAATGQYVDPTNLPNLHQDSPTTAESPLIIECASLNNEIENVVNVLFLQLQQCLDACVIGNLTSQQELNSIRNQNEVKRCFTTICMSYPDQLIANCLRRLEGPEKQKISALLVLRHIISSCDKQLIHKRLQIISCLRNYTGENFTNHGSSSTFQVSNNVKMQLSHTIIAMGGKNYLSEVGGLKLIEFIVRQCALSTKSELKNKKLKFSLSDNVPNQLVTNAQLRNLCENVLKLSSSTISSMRSVLWPYLMELIVPVEFTDAVGTLCCSIYNLFSSDIQSLPAIETEYQDESDPNSSDIECIVDYDTHVNIPGPQFLMSRLIVLAGVPTRCNYRGIYILKAMQILVHNFHENLPSIWNIIIPKLILYLEKLNNNEMENDNENEFDTIQWEELLLKLVAKSIEHINDEEWTIEFGEAMGQQISLYDKLPEERGFLFKCLGTVLANSTKKTFIDKQLDLIFHSTRHSQYDERMGFAIGFGLCAASHLDIVLMKLDLYYGNDAKRTTGLFGLFKDKVHTSDSSNIELLRANIILASANAIFYAKPELVPSRLESNVIKILQNNIKYNKDKIINRIVVESIDLVARAVNYNKLKHNYKFELRNDLVSSLLNYIEAESSTVMHNDLRAIAMRTIGNLIVLYPPITNMELQRILNVCIENVFNLPPDGIPLKKSKEIPFDDAHTFTILMDQTMNNLIELMKTILKTFFSDLTFTEIYKVIRTRFVSEHEHIRDRALSTVNLLLNSYYDEINAVNNNGKSLNCIGTLFGDVIPRLADPNIKNRQLAIDCVTVAFKIQLKLEIGSDPATDSSLNAILTIKERLKKFDSNILFAAVNDITKMICKRINTGKIHDLLDSLYEGLKDTQKNGASAVGIMFNALFRTRYSDLNDEVASIFTKLHDIIPFLIDNPKTGVLRALKILSSKYLIECLNTAMAQTLPLDEVWTEILCNIADDEPILDKCLVHIMEIHSRTMPFEEREDPNKKKAKCHSLNSIRYSCHVWLAAMNCLQILCSNTIKCGHICLTKMYSKLFTSIIIGCSSTISCLPFTGKTHEKKSGLEANLAIGIRPITICSETLKNFLTTTLCHEMIEEINVQNGWDKLENEDEFMSFMSLLSRSICINKLSEIGNIITDLSNFSNSNYEQHRILVTGFYGSTIVGIASANLDNLIDIIIALLLSRLGDKCLEVRRLSLVGIGNIGQCDDAIVQRHATSLLSALLMGMDDRKDADDKLINAAMDGLASLITKLTEKDIRDILVTVCLRMLSCYERDSANVRASAFRLFGSLARLATGPSYNRFLTEINSVIVPLLVHLEDPSTDVIRACKVALKQIMPLYSTVQLTDISNSNSLTTNKLNDFIESCLREDIVLHFGEFTNDFSKIFVVHMPEKVNDIIMRSLVYFKSEYPELAASSVLLIGCLMENLQEKEMTCLQKGQICLELIQLLKYKNAKVRARAAEAISLLHMY